MSLLPRLDRRGAVFSHEVAPENFSDGAVHPFIRGSGEEHVISPIVDAFRGNAREITGCHLDYWTGAFWDKGGGIPVLAYKSIAELIRIAGL